MCSWITPGEVCINEKRDMQTHAKSNGISHHDLSNSDLRTHYELYSLTTFVEVSVTRIATLETHVKSSGTSHDLSKEGSTHTVGELRYENVCLE